MKSTDIAFTIFIIVVFLGLYVSNILAIGMKKVKDNWPLYRCSPAVMPFASIFGHDVGGQFHAVYPSNPKWIYGLSDDAAEPRDFIGGVGCH